MRKLGYLIIYWSCLLAPIGIFFASIRNRGESAGLVFVPLACLGFLMCTVIYRMWKAIADAQTKPTPGQAVGYMFIPFYNLYWMFRAISGYPDQYNEYVRRHGLDVPRLGDGVFSAYPFFLLASCIPAVGVVFGLFNMLVVAPLLIGRACDAVSALPATGSR
jgi:hypothetical protein